MAKKKTSGAVAEPLATAYPAESPWWPSEFAPMRFAMMHAVFLILLGVILYFGATYNTLVSFKTVAAWALGVYNPLNLGPGTGSMDIAVLIWCGFLVLGNALLHPSLGLVTLALLRPWLDGYTFKTDNVYFLWGAVLILALWGVRAVFRNEPVRLPLLTVLSAGYLLVALALSPFSINFGETYKQLLNWTGYVAVFAITVQNLSNPRTQRFVLIAVLVGMALQAIFAVLQFHFVLPFLRGLINQDPAVLMQYFGVDHVTPEMQHRFNKNRAFGTVLFPNALAAFLILGIPGCFALLRNALQDFLPHWAQRTSIKAADNDAHRRSVLAASSLLWFSCMVVLLSVLMFPASYLSPDTQGLPWYLNIYFLFGVACAIALVPAAGYFVVALRRGFPLANRGLLLVLMGLSLFLMLWALWLSYSRGGTLALVGGCAVALALAYAPRPLLSRLLRWAPAVAALALCVGMGTLLFTAAVPQADAALDTTLPALVHETVTAQANTRQVTRAGENVTMADLANPESFSLRLSYWRVGLSMFADNALTGVGLGNFKWAYPVYQYLGAGNVQEAHNSFLQAFTETGLVGGVVIILFWLAVLIWLARAIANDVDIHRRRIVIGLTAGLVAFLLHSAIDINFAQPTLMFYAMLFAGLACVFASGTDIPQASTRFRLPVVAFLVLGAAFAVGLSTRPYLQNLALSRMQFMAADTEDAMMKRFDIARYVMVGSPEARLFKRPPSPVTVRALSLFEIDLQKYVDLSRVYAPATDGSGKLEPLEGGVEITEDSQLLFLKPWYAARQMEEDARGWMDELMRQDARFPHDPQLALHISNWYQLTTYAANSPWLMENPDAYYGALIEWSDQAIARNPLNADVHMNKTRSLISAWRRNTADLAPLRQVVEIRKHACTLAPAQGVFEYELADALKMLAEQLDIQGDAAGAAAAREEELAARDRGWERVTFNVPPNRRKPAPHRQPAAAPVPSTNAAPATPGPETPNAPAN